MSRIGELLVRESLISPEQLLEAVEESRNTGGRIGYSLTKLGYIDESELTNFLSKQYHVPSINLSDFDIDEEVIELIPKDVSQKHRCIPINRAGSSLIVAMSDPSNIYAIDDLKFLTGYNIEVVVASEVAIEEAFHRYYDKVNYDEVMEGFDEEEIDFGDEEDDVNVVDLEKASNDAPVVRLVNAVLISAIKKRASDIHVEPYEKKLRVRYRVDGVLYEEMAPPLRLKNALVSRLKIMSSLDIAERRLPQDGRATIRIGDGEVDVRISSIPTTHGERIVMRLLDKTAKLYRLDEIGLSEGNRAIIREYLSYNHGIILVTGPTGSGKTTTLYASMSEIDTTQKNVLTIEDPVEYSLGGISQVQVNTKKGLTFAAGLRSFLRQDPDVMMVVEIRDLETAEVAIRAALTGHLVFSTVHTNDAPSTITRMIDQGVEPYLVASSLVLIIAQRLVRTVCKHCKEQAPIDEEWEAKLQKVGLTASQLNGTVAVGRGCDECFHSGYSGRTAIYEFLPVDQDLRTQVMGGATASEIKVSAAQRGMISLRADGRDKICAGVTTPDEVLRVTQLDVE